MTLTLLQAHDKRLVLMERVVQAFQHSEVPLTSSSTSEATGSEADEDSEEPSKFQQLPRGERAFQAHIRRRKKQEEADSFRELDEMKEEGRDDKQVRPIARF